jgi:cytochrome c-type biogenesis protein CcmH
VTTFLIVCAVMTVAALAILLVPLLRQEPAAPGEAAPTRAVPAAVAMMVALPLAASAFYATTSNFPWDNPDALTSGAAGHGEGAGSMDEVTTQLEARLEQAPGDLEGWRMLGRTYLVTGRAADAARAYDRASKLSGGKDLAIELDLAEALVLAGEPAALPRAAGILEAALAADGANQKALWYSGLLAARGGDTETAKARWTRLLESDPPPEIREILVSQLAQLGVEVPAEEGAAAPAMAAAPAAGAAMGGGMGGDPGAAPRGRTLRVAISVDPALADKVKPGTLVFVSAREAGIPGPPIAAVRISTDELPTTVVLSDANAMIEGRDLSSVDELQLVARVAFGGTVTTTPGDLVGEGAHRKGAPEDVAVVINRVSP